MAEFSYLWTTNAAGAGDQVASYTQAQLAEVWRITGACGGFEGVAPYYLNELECTDGGANTVDVDTGGAIVDGKPYLNDTSEGINIPSAVGGGNTRIDRLVLRATWASFEVRITRIAGTDAAVPVAPAITQTSGTTYDIQLCQVLVDTAGAVTVTDERVWSSPHVDGATLEVDQTTGELQVKALGIDTAQLAAAAVTTAKVANDAVTDVQAGDRVPQFYRRQGGDPSQWGGHGNSGTTNYTPGPVRMQGGMIEWLGSDTSGTVFVTFPVAFSAAPLVFASCITQLEISIRVVPDFSNPEEAFIIAWKHLGATSIAELEFYWLAIGPE
jgi:hypothetical protein